SCTCRRESPRERARRMPGFRRSPRERMTTRSACEPLLLAQLRREARPLERRQVLDEDLALQMVHFVLDAYGEKALGIQLERRAVLVERADPNAGRAGHLVVIAGNRKA